MTLDGILFCVGPTAAGKSAAGLALAKAAGGEIVSCDAMQVYREVDIASNKPTPEERRQVPHHCLDVVSVTENFNVSRYAQLARTAITDILSRGKVPVVVGGSGLYFSALMDGVFSVSSDPEIRRELMRRCEREGSEAMHRQLAEFDPQAAESVHPNDVRRIVRAWEVYLLTGRPKSALQSERRGLWQEQQQRIRVLGLQMHRRQLYERIDQRVEDMMARGLVEEIRRVSQMRLSQTASKIIGLPELMGHFSGHYSCEEAVRLIKRNSRRYAKRQLTWFRKDQRVFWMDTVPDEQPETLLTKLTTGLNQYE